MRHSARQLPEKGTSAAGRGRRAWQSLAHSIEGRAAYVKSRSRLNGHGLSCLGLGFQRLSSFDGAPNQPEKGPLIAS